MYIYKIYVDRICFPMCWFGVYGTKMHQKQPNLLYGPWSQTPALDSGLCIPLLGRLAVKVCLQNPGLALLVLDGDLLKDIFIMSLLSGPGCAAWVLNL